MIDNLWVDKILDELVRLQSRNEDTKYRPLGRMGLRLSMLRDASAVDTIAWEDALQELSGRGLIELPGGNLVQLSDQGWKQMTGAVPGGERDEQFLVGVLDVLEDQSVRKNNDFVSARDVYERLDWRPFDPGQAHALANRLERQGLATVRLTNGDALVYLTYKGVREAERLRREPVEG